jgi:Arc/MetJ-type ribon-helix-helix transcriptional regulator
MANTRKPQPSLWDLLETKLDSLGVDLDELCNAAGSDLGARIKMVCVSPDLGESVRDLGKSNREHVVMVRVDTETRRKLDAWVETGAVKSRSEAAALFIREGLKVRDSELSELQEAIDGVEEAKERLREKARGLFGDASESAAGD